MVESSPTYLRDKSTLSSIKTKAATEGQIATEEAQGSEGLGGVITF
jgi:cell division protein ftsZ